MEAIVYVRWSTEDQTIGDSKKRQTDLAQKLCQAQGWTISETVVEAGKSAFHGRHRAAGGKLAEIEKRAAAGELVGKALIVEAMDRLSRERPEESLALLNNLTRQGLTIAESSTHLIYTAKAIADNWQTLLIPFIRAGLAHEESLNKSKRVKAAYQTTMQRGHKTKDGLVDMRFAPTWIERVNNTYYVNEQRAGVIRLMYQRAADGYGLRAISGELNASGVRWQKGDWNQANIAQLLRSRKALGEHVSREGEVRKLFPAIISTELWHRAQQGLDQRRSTGGPRRKLVNLLQGFTYCRACGSRMIITQNDKKQPRKARLRCAKNHRAGGCTANASYHYQHLLNGILDNVLDLALPFLPPLKATLRRRASPQRRWNWLTLNAAWIGSLTPFPAQAAKPWNGVSSERNAIFQSARKILNGCGRQLRSRKPNVRTRSLRLRLLNCAASWSTMKQLASKSMRHCRK